MQCNGDPPAVDDKSARAKTIGGPKKVAAWKKLGISCAAVAVALPVLSACSSGSTPGTLNVYAPADGASFIKQAAETCAANSKGEYKINTFALPKAADDQRLQLARRLAGNDHGLDLMGMDVVWTAEFADAGWIEPVPDELAARIKADTLGGPYETAVWKTDDDEAKRLYAIPTWTNTQLLWYRPDVLQQFLNKDTPPVTWDEMLADNEIIRKAGGPSYIMVQGKQYEGLMVWFNSVLSSAGGQVVDPNDPNKQTLNDTPEHRAATVKALQTLKSVATAPGADPSITNSDESSARLGMESGKATFEVNWPFVFPSMRSNAGAGDVAFLPEVKQEFGPLFADPDNPPPDNELAPVNDVVRTKFDFARYPGVLPRGSVQGDPRRREHRGRRHLGAEGSCVQGCRVHDQRGVAEAVLHQWWYPAHVGGDLRRPGLPGRVPDGATDQDAARERERRVAAGIARLSSNFDVAGGQAQPGRRLGSGDPGRPARRSGRQSHQG